VEIPVPILILEITGIICLATASVAKAVTR
jgi:hypothetical protein